ncbi:MAG: hypothetical protein H6621_06225 [Halobacteriovoraceae bacterium]|nr:hypothetical protein [Halobacteriovoraceae bacterium]
MRLKHKLIAGLMASVFCAASMAAINANPSPRYKTSFGSCSSKLTGELTLLLIKTFEKKNSLKHLKNKIVKENLKEKYFLSEYRINYNPIKKQLEFQFDCPKPLAKVQVYKNDGSELYTAILVEGGKVFDPYYDVILRKEKKLEGSLPFFAVPEKAISEDIFIDISRYLQEVKTSFLKKISEVMIDKKNNLTVIISEENNTISVFLGKNEWNQKTTKLIKTIDYFSKKNKYPSIVKFTSSKKVVVKFSHNL